MAGHEGLIVFRGPAREHDGEQMLYTVSISKIVAIVESKSDVCCLRCDGQHNFYVAVDEVAAVKAAFVAWHSQE
jgi:hypothetical protein